MRSNRWGVSASFCLAFLVACVLCSEWADAGSVRLSWKDTSNIEHGFKIERLAGSGYATIATVGPNIQSYTDANVKPGKTYCYRVSAFNPSGVSLSSNAACATATHQSIPLAISAMRSPTPPTASRPNSSIHSFGKWSNYQITANVRSAQEGSFGVFFRYQDRENYYRFLWDYEKKIRWLEKRSDGLSEVLAQDTVSTAGGTHGLEITADGSLLKVGVNGLAIISVTDSSRAVGTIGLYAHQSAATAFDDVVVTEIPSGNVLLSDNFNKLHYYRGWTIIDERNPSRPPQWSASTKALVRSGIKSESLGSYALFTRGSWRDYNVTLKMRSGDRARSGVMFRFEDSNNHYRFSCDGLGRRLIKQEQGTPKILAEDAIPCIVGKTYLVQILADGSSLQVKLDGALTFSVDDESFQGGTLALLSSIHKSTTYDDILIEELPTKSILLNDDFSSGKVTGWTVFDEPGDESQSSAWKVIDEELVQSNVLRSKENDDSVTFVIH